MLRYQPIRDTLDFVPDLTKLELEELNIPEWLRCGSVLSPLCGFAAAIVVSCHVFSYANKLSFAKKLDLDRTPWRTTATENMVMLVIAMPIVFVLMAMRAEIR